MKRTLVIALAGATAVAGFSDIATPARADEAPPARSVETVRQTALAAMNAGQLEQVQWRGKRNWRGGRSWRGGRHHGRRHYHRRGRGGRGAAVAAGVAGLAVGAMIAGSAARAENRSSAKQWCADRYRSYDWRSETFVGNDGRRRACP
ncbi:BA14K family protein [Methylopila sp. M107]|uniref:BA14K family protein n=1 Tax=Methylopila sp. M107 TaxID=1101190 RepID=UPI00037EEC3A|nr:BA14K family protein [Methylopila sp. M107]